MIKDYVKYSIEQYKKFVQLTYQEFNNKNIIDAKYYARKAIIHSIVFETEGSYEELNSDPTLQDIMVDISFEFTKFLIDSKIYNEYQLCEFLQDECMRLLYNKRKYEIL